MRSVDPVDPPLDVPDARYILGRGPFGVAAERTLLAEDKIDVVLAKNSGGDATYAKIAAARDLGIEVVLVRRPAAQRRRDRRERRGGVARWPIIGCRLRRSAACRPAAILSPRSMIRVSAEPMMTQVAMSALAGSASPSGTLSMRSSGRPAARPKITGVVAGRLRAQAFEGAAELPGPRLADRVVERDHEAGLRCRVEAAFDQLPGLQIVGQRDRAEIMAERRADARGDRQHRGDAGHDGQLDVAPFRRAGLDRLADCRRHGEHAGIAAGNHGDVDALAARISAAEARDSSSRLSEAWRVWPSTRSSRSR